MGYSEGMTLVHFPQAQDSHPTGHVPRIWAAVDAFFVHRDLAPNSRRTYRAALDPLVEAVGAAQPLAALTPDAVAEVFTERWGDAAPSTWNTRRAAVRAFVSWCEDRWALGADPLAGVGPRRQPTDSTRAVPYRDLDELWRRSSVPLREKTLWRMLYETAARASEALALDVEDLDRPQRRARVVSKGGNTDMIYWATPTARLLARYLAGRNIGATVPHHRPLPHPHPPARPPHPDRPSPAQLPHRRRPIRPTLRRLDPPPTAPLVALPPGRGRRVSGHAPGQEPPPRPTNPRRLHPARSRSRRPSHRRPVRRALSGRHPLSVAAATLTSAVSTHRARTLTAARYSQASCAASGCSCSTNPPYSRLDVPPFTLLDSSGV